MRHVQLKRKQPNVLITYSGNDMKKIDDGLTNMQRFYRANRDNRKTETSKFYAQKRIEVVELLGGKCMRCDFSDIRALQIDHVNGSGIKDRKSITKMYYPVVIESVSNKEGKYQLLCANCNWIKRFENNEVRKAKWRL